jgi:hypothetical protein
MPLALIRTRTCPWPGLGRAIDATRKGSLGPSRIAALIVSVIAMMHLLLLVLS